MLIYSDVAHVLFLIQFMLRILDKRQFGVFIFILVKLNFFNFTTSLYFLSIARIFSASLLAGK